MDASMGSQRVRHDWSTFTTFAMHIKNKRTLYLVQRAQVNTYCLSFSSPSSLTSYILWGGFYQFTCCFCAFCPEFSPKVHHCAWTSVMPVAGGWGLLWRQWWWWRGGGGRGRRISWRRMDQDRTRNLVWLAVDFLNTLYCINIFAFTFQTIIPICLQCIPRLNPNLATFPTDTSSRSVLFSTYLIPSLLLWASHHLPWGTGQSPNWAYLQGTGQRKTDYFA